MNDISNTQDLSDLLLELLITGVLNIIFENLKKDSSQF